MMGFRKAEFVTSAPSVLLRPKDNLPEILLVGRSNVGKSSLLNALTSRKSLAFVSSKPGHTKLLNYFKIEDYFYLVDAPGYGFAYGSNELKINFGDMMEEYFRSNANIKGVITLLDIRRELNDDDFTLFDFLKINNIPFKIVITKADKCNQSEIDRAKNYMQSLGFISSFNDLLICSSKTKKGIDKVVKGIKSFLE